MKRGVALLLITLTLLAHMASMASAQGTGQPSSRPQGSPVQPTIALGHNGMDTSFARAEMDPRIAYDGRGTPIEARFVIKNASQVTQCQILMFGFNALSPSTDVVLSGLETRTGAAIPISQDNRTDSRQQPKIWILPHDLPLDEEVVLRGRVTAKANGQFHIGAIVIAFDDDWNKCVTPRNEYAEVYAFGLLAVVDAVEARGRAPFEGQGNIPGVPGLAVVLGVLAGLALHRRRASVK